MPPRSLAQVDETTLLALRLRPALTVFSAHDDRAIRREWGRLPAEVIAARRDLSLSALLYRARRLGLRCASRIWPCHQVEAWLCLSASAWPHLAEEGLEWWALTDRRGRGVEQVVSTTSLARWLSQGNRWQRLVSREGADEFFCREILESASELQHAPATSATHSAGTSADAVPAAPRATRIFVGGASAAAARLRGAEPAEAPRPRWEYCKFLGPDHTCRNPFAACHRLFCSNSERYAAGDDPKCESRRLPLPHPGAPAAAPGAGRGPL